jgi:hypothetical protein
VQERDSHFLKSVSGSHTRAVDRGIMCHGLHLTIRSSSLLLRTGESESVVTLREKEWSSSATAVIQLNSWTEKATRALTLTKLNTHGRGTYYE